MCTLYNFTYVFARMSTACPDVYRRMHGAIFSNVLEMHALKLNISPRRCGIQMMHVVVNEPLEMFTFWK